jgi:enoyl-CoA hydratase
MFGVIEREDINGIAVITLAHGKVSALDTEFCTTLAAALGEVSSSSARAMVLTGTGSAFSAGVDLFRVMNGGAAYLSQFLPAMDAFFRTLLTFPKPAVAAVNGHAIAGGCIIAAGCDYRVMSEGKVRIGVPELLVGVPFPVLPFEMVRARVTPSMFHQLVLSGKTMTAAEALVSGLVDEVAPADVLMTRAIHTAEELARIPPISYALTKRAFAEPVLERVSRAAVLNEEAVAAWASPAVQERMRAYVEQTVGKK